eukprot:scaffold1849_cov239-Pinguiococcus_pyrenoidosus.AAC.10
METAQTLLVKLQGESLMPRPSEEILDIADVNMGLSAEEQLREAAKSRTGIDRMTAAIASGADVNASDDLGATALHWAARAGNVQGATILLDHAANIEAPDIAGIQPLRSAAYMGHSGVVELLLERGADLTRLTRENKSALSDAKEQRQVGVVGLLEDHIRANLAPWLSECLASADMIRLRRVLFLAREIGEVPDQSGNPLVMARTLIAKHGGSLADEAKASMLRPVDAPAAPARRTLIPLPAEEVDLPEWMS